MDEQQNNVAQPGQTVTPTEAAGPAPPAAAPAPSAPAQPEAPAPTAPPATPDPDPAPETPAADATAAAVPEPEQPAAPQQESASVAEAAGEDEAETEVDPEDVDPEQTVAWTASEFVAHAKSFGWYAVLGLAAVIGAALIYYMTRDYVSVAVILVACLLLGVYAGHKPREMEYRLDLHGLTVGDKHFGYNEFRSFSVLPEGAFSSIVFMPLRRFAIPTTIYYAPEDEDKIVNLLSDHLPLEEGGHDAIDRLLHRIHF